MNSGKGVRRSFHPSLHFSANFEHTPSPSFIIPTSHGSISLTFNFSHHPIPLCPFPTLICLPLYISQSHLLFPLPAHTPPSFTFSSTLPSIFPRALSLLVSASFCLSLSVYVSITSLHLLTHHVNYCAVNSSGVTFSGVTVLSRSWVMCRRSICAFKTTNLGQSSV